MESLECILFSFGAINLATLELRGYRNNALDSKWMRASNRSVKNGLENDYKHTLRKQTIFSRNWVPVGKRPPHVWLVEYLTMSLTDDWGGRESVWACNAQWKWSAEKAKSTKEIPTTTKTLARCSTSKKMQNAGDSLRGCAHDTGMTFWVRYGSHLWLCIYVRDTATVWSPGDHIR